MKVYISKSVDQAVKNAFKKHKLSPDFLSKQISKEMYDEISARLKSTDAVTVLCGTGNNSGYGYEIARLLKERRINVICINVFDTAPVSESSLKQYEEYIAANGKTESDIRNAVKIIAVSDVVIDAIFGIGFTGNIEPHSAAYKTIDVANNSHAYRISIDVPSGIRCDDGSVGNIAFAADETFTIAQCKVGMMSYPARFFCGRITTVKVDAITEALNSIATDFFVPDEIYLKKSLPKRMIISNKGDYGKLLLICGSKNMTGAAVLSAKSALRVGTGLVTLASEEKATDCVRICLPEPVYLPVDFENESDIKKMIRSLPKYDVLLVGCGLGTSQKKKDMLKYIVNNAAAQLVIDADGINMLANNINILKEAHKVPIITPHPAEFSRISGLDIDYINDNRIKCALEFSQKYRCITVLKGAGTVTASPDGIVAVNNSGNPGLAKGGSGDVLAGLIAGLAANPSVKAFDAAVCGVYLHGRAADILRGKYSEYGLLPSDIPEEVAKLLP